jgi:hypothetical protein
MRRAVVAAAVSCTLVAGCDTPLRPTAPPAPSPADAPAALAAAPTQSAADAISANVQAVHLVGGFPHPTIVDPRYTSETSTTLEGYARAGDAAIWSGHYLAAEAFRYWETGSSDALANAERALRGIQGLVDVTSDAMPRNRGLLARFLWPRDWRFDADIRAQEASHGIYAGTATTRHWWLGNTTRDQYSGVFFGLAIAYDAFALIPEPTRRDANRDLIRSLVTRMLDFLLRNGWSVRMPNGSYSTTFLNRPDQQLTLLQIGRHVSPRRYEIVYRLHRAFLAPNVLSPIAAECQDPHGSYYKFNLNHINLYNLIRLERDPAARVVYLAAFDRLRACTGGRQPTLPPPCPNPDHQNAHFNTIEAALLGPNPARDAATNQYLGLWLDRGRRDKYIDHGTAYGVCQGDRATEVIPVDKRTNTDFLWQRSPFLIRGPDKGGQGKIETPAIDYLLPYWMGRHYGVIDPAPTP